MRACVQCGLSISETATFCQVCGVRIEEQPVALAVAELEPVAELQLAAEPELSDEPDLVPAPELDAAEPEPVAAQPELAAEPDLVAAEPEPEPEPEESPEDALERRMAGVSALLEEAAASEDGDPAAAAIVLREAILECLDATEDPTGSDRVRRDLLCGFDRLSALLQREGLPEEALEVADDAAALGLLSGVDEIAARHRDAVRDRREDLRRILYADSAQL